MLHLSLDIGEIQIISIQQIKMKLEKQLPVKLENMDIDVKVLLDMFLQLDLKVQYHYIDIGMVEHVIIFIHKIGMNLDMENMDGNMKVLLDFFIKQLVMIEHLYIDIGMVVLQIIFIHKIGMNLVMENMDGNLKVLLDIFQLYQVNK